MSTKMPIITHQLLLLLVSVLSRASHSSSSSSFAYVIEKRKERENGQTGYRVGREREREIIATRVPRNNPKFVGVSFFGSLDSNLNVRGISSNNIHILHTNSPCIAFKLGTLFPKLLWQLITSAGTTRGQGLLLVFLLRRFCDIHIY